MAQPERIREAHAHLASHGRAMSMVSLASCRNDRDCLAVISEAARRSGGRSDTHDRRAVDGARSADWIMAVGARVEGWEVRGRGPSGWPTLDELDAVSADRPCVAMSFDHHMVMANSAALRAAGVMNDTPDPPGGVYHRDSTGALTGLLLETAAWKVWGAAPEPGESVLRRHVVDAITDLARHGFVEVHDLLSQRWLGPLLAERYDRGELPATVLLHPALEEIQTQLEASRSWSRPRVVLSGAKIFVDGTLNSRTAWMLHPYREAQDGIPTGKIVTPPERIEAALRTTRSMGIGLAVHAIGDGAVRATLDAFERVYTEEIRARRRAGVGRFLHATSEGLAAAHSPKSADAQHRGVRIPALRIEHAELIDAADVPRFADLGVVVSVQPCHLLADIEALHRYLPHRLDRVLPLRDLIDAGCVPGEMLWFGSDTPIVRPDPGDSVQAAVHRRRFEAPESDAIAPAQAITQAEALACFGVGFDAGVRDEAR
jgi:predicted amidohydrolase YtcJ